MTEDDIEQALLLLRFWYKLSTDPQFSMDNPWEIRRDYELQTDEFLSKHERQEAEHERQVRKDRERSYMNKRQEA